MEERRNGGGGMEKCWRRNGGGRLKEEGPAGKSAIGGKIELKRN